MVVVGQQDVDQGLFRSLQQPICNYQKITKNPSKFPPQTHRFRDACALGLLAQRSIFVLAILDQMEPPRWNLLGRKLHLRRTLITQTTL